MQSTARPKASDEPRDFVVVHSDQVRVAPSDAEITDLLRAAARRSETSSNAASNASEPASVPAVDTTFRAVVDDDAVRARSAVGRRVMRVVAALLLAAGIGGAAVGWQFFGYAAKKAVAKWLPQMALTTSISLDKLGLGTQSEPAEPAAAEETSAPAEPSAPAQAASESAPASAAAPASDSAQLLQSMARDLANLGEQVETLKSSIAELKASHQQILRDRAVEQAAKAKAAAVVPPPHPSVTARKPAPVYAPTPTPLPPPPANRPMPPSAPTQAAATPPPPIAQPYVPRQVEPPPIPRQPQAEQPGLASVPRPPMPVQQ